jgi:putative spermidine/putrescine transport system permease protein
MILSRAARRILAVVCGLGLLFLYLPLMVVVSTAVSTSGQFDLPPDGFTLEWFSRAFDNEGAREALGHSLLVAACATLVALVLGTLLSFAVHRFRFFGRDTISLMVVLPIALPGIVTALALNLAFDAGGLSFGLVTLVLAHSTFCIVVAFNNVVARLRRLSPNIEEASADLGASSVQTFRHITFPMIRSALLAGGLLAFALSFDEIVVTTFTAGNFQTLPQWILNNTFRAKNVGEVAAVATLVILISVIPVWIAQRVSDDVGH